MFQAVGHRAADCFIDLECLRLVSQQAVSLLDQDLPATGTSTDTQEKSAAVGPPGPRAVG